MEILIMVIEFLEKSCVPDYIISNYYKCSGNSLGIEYTTRWNNNIRNVNPGTCNDRAIMDL